MDYMVDTIRISQSAFAKNIRKLRKLNDLISIPDTTLSIGYLTGATGCESKDALYIILMLYEMRLGDANIVIYHKDFTDNAIMRTEFASGLPQTPFKAYIEKTDDEIMIESASELIFSVEIDLKKSVEFMAVGENE